MPSGRSVSERPPPSSNVNISLLTMSVEAPTPRANSSVDSNDGRLDPLVAGAAQERAGPRLERLAGDRLLAEHVEGAAGRFELRLAQRAAWGGGALAATGCSAASRARISVRNGFVASSRSSVVTPMCPG